MKKLVFLLIAAGLLCGLYLHITALAQEKTPFAPSVYLGDYQQAAIVLDFVWEADFIRDGTCPSIITEIWYDSGMGLYFAAAPDPLRLYHWSIGENKIR